MTLAELAEKPDDDPMDPRIPYQFDSAHPAVGGRLLDEACTGAQNYTDVALALAQAEIPDGVPAGEALRRELLLAFTYQLRLDLDGRDGCQLVALGGWLPPVREVTDQVVRLWRGTATAVAAPAAVARLEDLLFCRRDGNGRARVSRSAGAYLSLAQGGVISMDVIDAVVRAWTLARSVGNHDLEAQARAQMAAILEEVMDRRPGESPGVVVPLLGALAAGPKTAARDNAADPHDVDELLVRAAAVFVGNHATAIAGFRRRRTADTATLELIARDEVTGHQRHAEQATQPAVRMIRLREAAQVARARSLPDLQRDIVSAMQRIAPSELGLKTFEASSPLPPHVIEGFLCEYTRSADWRDALDEFLADDPPTGPIGQLRQLGRQTHQGLSRILPPMIFANGLPRATAGDPEAQDRFGMSLFAQVRAENIGRLMAEGLRRIADRYGTPGQDDLVDYFLSRGGRDVNLLRSLAKGFRHYWRGDTESCIYLVTPRLETAARNLLLELDEGIYRVEAAKDPGGYPGLYVLLDKLEQIALDESWAYFLRWLLLGPFGANLRNNMAHGLPLKTTPEYAALTLRAVAVLALVSSPVGPDGVGIGDRERSDLVKILATPPPVSGPIDGLLAAGGRILERAWWRVRTARARLARERDGRRERCGEPPAPR
ncbi:DUF4209 domain-containing protein [Asanoa siamensis]|uniref:DUF4209 domain-containing protein n=1 Tax=Asanoa siamensis TaxID=926357 RepID=UPI00194298A8|nr:DUF4209 domain-containing protein [Asanoa siamensis]